MPPPPPPPPLPPLPTPTPTNPATSWLDIMPAIPLARAVPVAARVHCYLGGTDTIRGVCVDPADDIVWMDGAPGETDEAARVDLDDPQGFAYALRALCRPTPSSVHYDVQWAQLIDRHLCGETTDADRLALATALAKAMAEVSR